MPEYITVSEKSSAEIEMKKSRFISCVAPVDSADDAARILLEIKNANKKARHNVHAYVLRGSAAGFSDDGEPQGTAGKPILDILRGSGLSNTMIVVTRYFGGILLGTGGLVRAYSDAAKKALEASSLLTMQSVTLFQSEFDYTHYGKISSLISEFGGKTEDVVYKDNIVVSFYIPDELTGAFLSQLSEATLGSVNAEKIGNGFRAKDIH